MVHWMAFVVVFMAAGAEGLLLFGGKPNIDDILIGRILGTLDSALFLVLTFYFGSSAQGQRAGQRAADTPPPPPTPPK